eukprot:TRINITY_DN9616_c0_g1_i1.p1 TRINITY_DN9616_c0_g1~~TRINITY_DN9616_c0_g1_i1.p1  ORF type:complete len:619 (+),score=165.04 TRINITY_DN9616_c0_g1_i1:39-1895(+)
MEHSNSGDMLPGEQELLRDVVDIADLRANGREIRGALILTNFQIIFKSDGQRQRIEKIPLGVIQRGEKSSSKKILELHLKNFKHYVFIFSSNAALEKFSDYIIKFAFPEKSINLFAYYMDRQKLDWWGKTDGWRIYNPFEEYFDRMFRSDMESSGWKITTANNDYVLCDTYPRVLVVPSSISDETLEKVAEFRSKGRIPILCWKNPTNAATITRSSQPQVGITGQRSVDDEKLFNEIIKTNPGQVLYLMDARPRLNAATNQAISNGGSENLMLYGNITLEFLGIENIHIVRESFKKLKAACLQQKDDGHWYANLENSRWMEFTSLLLSASTRIAAIVNRGQSVLVHCSDGWDRTSQLVALASLLLDPFYRTMVGFEVLIEKEWITAGHKFEQRYGHGQKNFGDTQRSPIFVQFIDCVYQLTQQFPTAFQFNEEFLLVILDSLYSCEYGTFLCNNEKDREDQQVKGKTASLWSYTNHNASQFTNAFYEKQTVTPSLLLPASDIKALRFWNSYYLPFFHLRNPMDTLQAAMKATQIKMHHAEDELAKERLRNKKLMEKFNQDITDKLRKSVDNQDPFAEPTSSQNSSAESFRPSLDLNDSIDIEQSISDLSLSQRKEADK